MAAVCDFHCVRLVSPTTATQLENRQLYMVKIVNYQFDGDYEYTLTGRCRAATQQSEDTRTPTTITGPSEVDVLLPVQPEAIVQPTSTLHTNAPTHTIYTHRYSTHL